MNRTISGVIFAILACLLLLSDPGVSGNVSDFLIIQDIGGYKFMGQGGGKGSGLIVAAVHFDGDHSDESYGALYFHESKEIGVKAEVTQHTGGDSDKWLLHEIDRDFRNYYGLPGDSYAMRVMDGNNIMAAGSGGWKYRWLCGNKVIQIGYTDLQMTKPEPLEVVKAYLAKHPSTLSPITSYELRNSSNKTKWIKDEMERRLWLCDKWFLQVQTGKAELNETLRTLVDHMVVFLDYRERYYGVKALAEKQALTLSLRSKDGTGIKAKLSDYKTWWAVNKGKSISVP